MAVDPPDEDKEARNKRWRDVIDRATGKPGDDEKPTDANPAARPVKPSIREAIDQKTFGNKREPPKEK